MTVFMDTTTGEINTVDELIELIKVAEYKMNELRLIICNAKTKLLESLPEGGGHTARIQGDKYKCKVEFPTKVAWDQKKLSHLYSIYPHGTIVDTLIRIGTYKVDMREYKKIINTVGNDEFNNFKEQLLSANLGTLGTPKFTIEE